MKSFVALFVGLFLTLSNFGQNQLHLFTDADVPSYSEVNYSSIYDFLGQNLDYPVRAREWGFEGTEVIRFQVTESGELRNFRVINSVSDDIDRSVIGTLKMSSGRWTPATVGGIPVPVEQEILVVYKINESTDFTQLAQDCLKKGNFLLYLRKKPKKALRYFDMAVNYLPNNIPALRARMFCKHQLGDRDGVLAERDRINTLAQRKEGMSREAMLVVKGGE